MTNIRISKVSDLATARACAALNINYIGLNLTHGSPNAISPIKVNDYIQWLSGIEVVAQAHHLDEVKAQKFMDLLNLKHVEILSENYVTGGKGFWYYGDNVEDVNGTIVSLNQNNKGYFVVTDLENISVNQTHIDLPITLFEQDEGINWELVDQVISKLKK
ncbi:MAG: hypothetical protein ACPGLV_00385 [Bacteroidia bacterium]